MPFDIWPLLRPFLVAAMLLAAMCEPKKKKERDAVPIEIPKKEEIHDAEYEQLD